MSAPVAGKDRSVRGSVGLMKRAVGLANQVQRERQYYGGADYNRAYDRPVDKPRHRFFERLVGAQQRSGRD